MIEVVFMVNDTGERVSKFFYSERDARTFKCKVEHSKKLTLIGCWNHE